MEKEEIVYKGVCQVCGEKNISTFGENGIGKSTYIKSFSEPCKDPKCKGKIVYVDSEKRIYQNGILKDKNILKGKEITDGQNRAL